MKIGVIVFPGSNCDHDAFHAVGRQPGLSPIWLWHESRELAGVDAVIIPGGFSYGDYLRTGAIARFSPILESLREFARQGGPVLGICNGFQILCESGLLPGALLPNAGSRFVCRPVRLRVENTATPFTNVFTSGQPLWLPVAHGEGNYYCDAATLAALEADKRVVFRYITAGEAEAGANPNGSLANIAGICSREGNVVGMMPHPERAVEAALGSADGAPLFQSLAAWLVQRPALAPPIAPGPSPAGPSQGRAACP